MSQSLLFLCVVMACYLQISEATAPTAAPTATTATAPVAGADAPGCNAWGSWVQPMVQGAAGWGGRAGTEVPSCKYRFRECRTMNPDINDAIYYPQGCGSMCDNTFLRRKVLEEGCRNAPKYSFDTDLRNPTFN